MKPQLYFLAVIAALFLVGGCGKSAPSEAPSGGESGAEAGHKEEAGHTEGEGHIELTSEALKTAGVRTGQVAQRSIQARLEVSGSVSIPGNARAMVTPPVAGKVVRLLANVGDRVTRGQPIAVIQSGDLAEANSAIAAAETSASGASAAVRQQAAAVELARGRLRTAQSNLARQRRFASAGAFSQPSLTAARNEVSEAKTEGAAASSELAGAKSRLERAERLSREGLVSKADLDQARLEVQQAQIRVDRSTERLTLAEGTLRRESRIGQQGLLNSREIQLAEAEARAAKLELDSARIALQGATSAQAGAQRAIGNARANAAALRGGGTGSGSTVTLTAPISGIVVERGATIGQAVERASDLFDIEDAAVVWVTANVPEADVSRVQPGGSVTVVTNAYPGRTFTGKVQLVGTRLDPKSRTLPVQCRVENPQRLLRADLFAKVQLATDGQVNALGVPVSAIVGEGDDQAVFISDDGKFERRKVKTGRTDGKFVEILEGLKAGDQIATAGVFTLQSELLKEELKGHED